MRDKEEKRIVVLTTGNIYDRKGFFNAVHNRIKHLKLIASFPIEVYLMSEYEPWYIRCLRNTKKHDVPSNVEIDGVCFHIFWHRFSLIDYILQVRLHCAPFFRQIRLRKMVSKLRSFDAISCHSLDAGIVAYKAKEKYHIPYCMTWHGSDVHSAPFVNKWVLSQTRAVMENAANNFFVSQNLLEVSKQITTKASKCVLYNGVSKSFRKYDKDKRDLLRKKYGVGNHKVVMFCGNLIAIKNVLTLPGIFRQIKNIMSETIFWIVGDGKYRLDLEQSMRDLPVCFWGNQQPEIIPDFMNVADVLLLPSLNEGLPLVALEALSCGCHVVGSNVGGIPEAIGENRVVSLDDASFEKSIAYKVIECFNSNDCVEAPASCFSWDETARKENACLSMLLSSN